MRLITKYSVLTMAALLSLGFSSCKNEVEDVFDEQPSLRVQHYIDNYRQVLTSAPNGWAVAFYGNTEYGGYNLLCKFIGSDSVRVANERFANDTTAMTHYKMEQSNGIVLSFDEYCPLVHYFSDPATPGFGRNGRAFEGDLEFRIISATADSVVMTGKKHGQKIVMRPLAEDISWADYLKQVHEVEKDMFSLRYALCTADGDTMVMKKNREYRSLSYNTLNEEGDRVEVSAPYIVTPQGYVFYQPFTFASQAVSHFAYQQQATKYQQDGQVALQKITAPLNEQLLTGVWYITYSRLGTLGRQLWNIARNNLRANGTNSGLGPLEIIYATLGHDETDFGLSFVIGNDEGLGYYWSQFFFDYTLEGDDLITMVYGNRTDESGNGETFLSYGLAPCITPFGNGTPRTFQLTCDNPSDPTYITLTDVNTRTNVITVVSQYTENPYDN